MLNRRKAEAKNRLKKGAITAVVYLVLVVALAWFFEAQSTTTIIFVRHAEKTSVDDRDPGLSEAGKQRARELSRIMQRLDVDRAVDEIYATQFKRTQETVRPLAIALGKDVHRYDAADSVTVLEEILREHKGKISLVAAHSNTIQPLIAELGGSKVLPPISEAEYDNLYIVVIPWFGKVKTLRLTYGTPFVAESR